VISSTIWKHKPISNTLASNSTKRRIIAISNTKGKSENELNSTENHLWPQEKSLEEKKLEEKKLLAIRLRKSLKLTVEARIIAFKTS